MLWGLLLPLPDPQAGESDIRLRILTPMGEPLYIYFPFHGSPTHWVWDLIILHMSPSYHVFVAFPLSLDVEYLFGRFQTFLSMAARQLAVILVFL